MACFTLIGPTTSGEGRGLVPCLRTIYLVLRGILRCITYRRAFSEFETIPNPAGFPIQSQVHGKSAWSLWTKPALHGNFVHCIAFRNITPSLPFRDGFKVRLGRNLVEIIYDIDFTNIPFRRSYKSPEIVCEGHSIRPIYIPTLISWFMLEISINSYNRSYWIGAVSSIELLPRSKHCIRPRCRVTFISRLSAILLIANDTAARRYRVRTCAMGQTAFEASALLKISSSSSSVANDCCRELEQLDLQNDHPNSHPIYTE